MRFSRSALSGWQALSYLADDRSAKGNFGGVQPFDTKTVASDPDFAQSNQWRVARKRENRSLTAICNNVAPLTADKRNWVPFGCARDLGTDGTFSHIVLKRLVLLIVIEDF